MIENKNEASRNLEKSLQALKQAKQHVTNGKKKQNEKKRKAEITRTDIPPLVVYLCALQGARFHPKDNLPPDKLEAGKAGFHHIHKRPFDRDASHQDLPLFKDEH